MVDLNSEILEDTYAVTPRTVPIRYRERVRYDRDAVHGVLDAGLVANVAFVLDGAPSALPAVYARLGETLYLHGSRAGRFARLGAEQADVCVTVTHLDGLVFARAWLIHSVAYRSVVVHGKIRLVTDDEERMTGLAAILEHVATGRSAQARPPTRQEFASVAVVAVDLEEVSCKIRREEQSKFEPADLQGGCWAGFVPLRQVALEARSAPDLPAEVTMPPIVDGYRGPFPVTDEAMSTVPAPPARPAN
ncbi:pyridoxamine 5'-phosphate oxidase family protein [Actinoplanes aureus]|uniref:Pyridoxamine 5'-phosphate oxidase family protein n=1 Tax=Actinoplanes aureus TaxID=2792083 RepID=A0A931C4Y7_9ACTN|nr:pyridoxamine 5'-phosphate oxidase family protein [Actinoplanes aureus]MBG0560216.1 pyridoxamine 5'-phosphate oxidase family protein [Actinoplanes aureus]